MRRKALIVIGLLLAAVFLSGCYDAVEIDDYAYVTTLGIERGVTDKLRFTFQIPLFAPSGKSGGGETGGEDGGKKEDEENIVIEAPTLLSAVADVNVSIPKNINFMHLKAIVISEDLAASGDVGEVVAPLVRYKQIRRTASVFVCKGDARSFLKALKPYLGGLVTQTIEELTSRSMHTGYFPSLTLGDMYDGIKAGYYHIFGIYAAVNKGENFIDDGQPYTGKYKTPGDYYAGDSPRKGGQDVELLGAVASDGDKMVGKFTGFETQMLLLVRGELKRAPFTIPDPMAPELVIPVEVKEFEHPEISVDISGDKPKIKVRLSMEGDITAVDSRINYEHPEMKKIVEESFENFIKDGIERTFAKCQAINVDVFEFGVHAVKKFLTIPEWENYNWLDKFKDAELEVNVDFIVRRTGKLLRSMPIISTEGQE